MRFRPRFESLEDRWCPSVSVQIDYSLDTNNFFNTQAKKDIMQLAADSVGELFTDSLAAINPGGGNTWTGSIFHPTTHVINDSFFIPNLTVPANTFILYVGGASNFTGNTIAESLLGEVSSVSGSQEFQDTVRGRGQAGALGSNSSQTDVGPWGGVISFSSTANWFFGLDPTLGSAGQFDFLSFALHETVHAMGFGTANSFENLSAPGGTAFNGALSRAAFDTAGGTPQVTADHGHWSQSTTDGGQGAIMTPIVTNSVPDRKYITGLDRAAMGDIGWQLLGDTDGTLATATASGVGTSTKSFTATGRSLDARIDADLYSFTGTAGQKVFVGTTASASGPSVDTFLRVFDAQGAQLATDDNSGPAGGYSQMVFTLPSTGTYFVGVSAAPNRFYSATEANVRSLAGVGTGNYDLTIATDPSVGFTTEAQFPSEGIGAATVTVQLSFPSSQSVVVPYAISGTSTGGGVDFTISAGQVTIPAGQLTASIPVQIVDDNLDETNETVILTLTSPTNGTLGSPTVQTLTILDNDPTPTVSLQAPSASIAEAGGTLNLSVTLSAASGLNVTIPFTLSGSAALGIDYTATASPLAISAGQTTATLTLTIINDALNEAAESINVSLDAPTNATLGTGTPQAIAITDDDPQPSVQFAATTGTVKEGNAPFQIVAQLSAVSGQAVTVPFTVSGTATQGTDFILSANSITISPGQLNGSASLTALADNPMEPDESVILLMATPTSATMGGQTSFTLTIQDGPPPAALLQLDAASFSKSESEGSFVVNVRRVSGGTGAVSVEFLLEVPNRRLKEQASLTADIQIAATGVVAFAAGELSKSITIPIVNDDLVEGNTEFFTLTLRNPSAGAMLGSPVQATLGINDEDVPNVPNAQPGAQKLQAAANLFGKSLEHYRDFVTKAYARFLGRLPDDQGLTFWVSLMQLYETSGHVQGLRQEQIEAGFIDSTEYKGRYGGVGEAWVRGIYNDLLGRQADTAGLNFWLGNLQFGQLTPTQVALGFTASDERLVNRVADTYRNLLDREPDQQGLSFWVALFKSGGTQEDIQSGFVGSAEYYNNPTRGAGNPAFWVKETYLDILFRPAAKGELNFWLDFLKT